MIDPARPKKQSKYIENKQKYYLIAKALILGTTALVAFLGVLTAGEAIVHRFIIETPWLSSEYPNGLPWATWNIVGGFIFYVGVALASTHYFGETIEEYIEQ